MTTKKKVIPKTESKTRTTRAKKIAESSAITPSPTKKQKGANGDFPIIGIGASAGGLQAFEEFFQHLPTPCGMAFVLVSHLDPDHASILHELLRKSTSLSVEQITDGISINKENVYVSPPGKDVAILNGTLQLMNPLRRHGARLPIDHFFRSLALDQKEKAIGIILSGNGSDGTLGITAIKSESGLVIAEDIQSAKFSGMPSSAIATGLVDIVLAPNKMPEHLISYINAPYSHRAEIDFGVTAPSSLYMQKIFLLLRTRTGHDFSFYKPTTLRRRIARRMSIHQISTHKQYVHYLGENPQEVDLLFKEFLIGVTSFFRDKSAFEALEKKALLALLDSKTEEDVIRVWIAGCSTGEEAYSIAILLQEMTSYAKLKCSIQIFATDLDSQAIETARIGLYPEGTNVDVSPQLLRKYFVKEDDRYRIKKEIREMVIFAEQNLIKDPPFTKLDLITCRNLLIYLNADLQRKLLPIFHYALKPNGVLFLGTSESIGGFTTLFQAIDKKWKLFLRKPGTASVHVVSGISTETFTENIKPVSLMPKKQSSIAGMLAKILSERYAPPSVIVNEKGEIIFIHGTTGHYLQPSPGRPNLNILAMAREGLRHDLAQILNSANRLNGKIIHKIVQVKSNGNFIHVNLSAHKIIKPEALSGLLIVTFETITTKRVSDAESEQTTPNPKKRRNVRELSLERELEYTKVGLQNTIEEMETSNEELMSTNEEMQSTNEEMQSSNEELETSKEEMQSLNEELQTVNAELQGKIDELSQANDDMTNLLNATDIATIFLDNNLHIKRFTLQATEVIRLIPSDVGRPISDIVSRLDYKTLEQDAKQVLRTLSFKEAELQAEDGSWYLMRIMPYRTAENRIDGLVVTFVDINRIKHTEEELAETNTELLWQRDFAENLIETAPAVVMVLNPEWKIIRLNSYMETLSGYSLSEVKGKNWFETFLPEQDREPIRRVFVQAVAKAVKEAEVQTETQITHGVVSMIITKNGQQRQIEWYEKPLKDRSGKITGFMAVGQDITEHKLIEEVLHENEESFRMFLKIASDSIVLINPKSKKFVEFNQSAHQRLGYTREEFAKLTLADIDASNSASAVAQYIQKIINQASNHIELSETQFKGKDGKIYNVQVKAKAITLGIKKHILSTWRVISPSKSNE